MTIQENFGESHQSNCTISDDLLSYLSRPTLIEHRGQFTVLSAWYKIISPNACDRHIVSAYHLDYLGVAKIKDFSPKGISESILDAYGLSSVRQGMKSLVKSGWLKEIGYTHEQVVALIRQKQPQVHKDFSEKCDWCDCSTVRLHEHHYPTPKSQGGTETVNVCPNCHYEFHALEKTLFCVASEKLTSFFNLPVTEAIAILGDI